MGRFGTELKIAALMLVAFAAVILARTNHELLRENNDVTQSAVASQEN